LYFDKKAVFLGGGDSHRLHLDDMILLKDNHILIAGGVVAAIKRVKSKASFSKKIEVEVTSPDETLEAAQAGADVIMLDNFSPEKIKCAVRNLDKAGLRRNVLLEASGGITEKNLLEYALARVDIVSLGEITQSPRALDMNMKIIRVSRN
jgi:nicotinate-nucleotide pyrophosphorylase (carboxylating)